MREGEVVVVSAGTGIGQGAIIREVRGSLLGTADPRFLVIALVSLGLHTGFAWYLHSMKIRPAQAVSIEKMSERFAKLIVDKPLPKETKKADVTSEARTSSEKTETQATPEQQEKAAAVEVEKRKAVAKKNVAARVDRVEKKIRTVGVLGMLTGVGTTAKGPSVVDVLGAAHGGKERIQDLEKALENMSGLKQAQDVEVLSRKLVKSKDVTLTHRESIDDLLSAAAAPAARDLAKQGDLVIQRPDAIEGAAASSAKRDDAAINQVVAAKRAGIRRTYQKHLKRDPNLEGKITVRFTITSKGTVTSVQILENTTGSGELGSDIVRQVKLWRFEEIPEGDVTVTYPFVFRPS